MNYALLVSTLPENSFTALDFAKATLRLQQKILAVFFHQQGVCLANSLLNLPVDEINLQNHWQEFAIEHTVPLIVCSSSALRRGITANQLANHFTLGSLGQLTEILLKAERVITFK